MKIKYEDITFGDLITYAFYPEKALEQILCEIFKKFYTTVIVKSGMTDTLKEEDFTCVLEPEHRIKEKFRLKHLKAKAEISVKVYEIADEIRNLIETYKYLSSNELCRMLCSHIISYFDGFGLYTDIAVQYMKQKYNISLDEVKHILVYMTLASYLDYAPECKLPVMPQIIDEALTSDNPVERAEGWYACITYYINVSLLDVNKLIRRYRDIYCKTVTCDMKISEVLDKLFNRIVRHAKIYVMRLNRVCGTPPNMELRLKVLENFRQGKSYLFTPEEFEK